MRVRASFIPGVEAQDLGAAVAQQAQQYAAPVGGVTLARDPVTALEPVEDAGHRRRVQPGHAGQRGRARRPVAGDQVKAVQVAGAQVEMPPDLLVEQRQLGDNGAHRQPHRRGAAPGSAGGTRAGPPRAAARII
jgi:hypothetical protein